MAAVGSRYHGNGNYAKPMHEFLRRAIMSVSNNRDSRRTMYCGSDELSQVAKSYHRDLNDFCCNEWKTSNQKPRVAVSQTGPNDSEHANKEWRGWYDAESKRRTGCCIWTIVRYLYRARKFDGKQNQLSNANNFSVVLHPSSTGEFSRILLIHGLFRRTWEVSNYLSQPLTHWTPTASKLSFQHTTSNHPIWLPGIQTYTNWRNSACDCLDILHWHANSFIGAASGMEHTTILHLHLARVVLLTPFLHILELAEYLASSHATRIPDLGDTDTDQEIEKEKEKEILQTRDYMKRGATEDQHKARLASLLPLLKGKKVKTIA
ncbi:hypothetical protein BPOR_0190g00030 [Botrytis porri]|uniref:Uncharacterized protein n=1 Tax=Botrytis porri TaxID=87229 RepID=A0A4Z1KU16_9HELO|nr:hypothetical protein BPOR_0190g00030 [Botrytis porri]